MWAYRVLQEQRCSCNLTSHYNRHHYRRALYIDSDRRQRQWHIDYLLAESDTHQSYIASYFFRV